MATMTTRRARNQETSSRCHAVQARAEEMEGAIPAQNRLINAAWMVSLGIAIAYVLVITGIVR